MLKKIGLGLLIILVAIQFIKTNTNNAEIRELDSFVNETQPSKQVTSILTSKCYDCHSNKTTYPWYAKIAPLSFWIDHHVEEGREHLDFSSWSTYNSKRKKHKLDELIEEVEEGEMPLESYEILHGDITSTEKEVLISWAKKAMLTY